MSAFNPPNLVTPVCLPGQTSLSFSSRRAFSSRLPVLPSESTPSSSALPHPSQRGIMTGWVRCFCCWTPPLRSMTPACSSLNCRTHYCAWYMVVLPGFRWGNEWIRVRWLGCPSYSQIQTQGREFTFSRQGSDFLPKSYQKRKKTKCKFSHLHPLLPHHAVFTRLLLCGVPVFCHHLPGFPTSPTLPSSITLQPITRASRKPSNLGQAPLLPAPTSSGIRSIPLRIQTNLELYIQKRNYQFY